MDPAASNIMDDKYDNDDDDKTLEISTTPESSLEQPINDTRYLSPDIRGFTSESEEDETDFFSSPESKDTMIRKGPPPNNMNQLPMDDGTFKRPIGASPKGCQWDKTRGVWAPKEPSPRWEVPSCKKETGIQNVQCETKELKDSLLKVGSAVYAPFPGKNPLSESKS